MPRKLRALTVRQPWAHAIAHLGKLVENRVWAPTHPHGPLLIHAGKGVDLTEAAFLFGYNGVPLPTREEMALGAIIAVAEMDGTCSATIDRPALCNCGPWAVVGDYHWRFAKMLPLPEPVPCRGGLSLWEPPADVLAAVTAQPGVGELIQ